MVKTEHCGSVEFGISISHADDGADKATSARELYKNLTHFSESIATDASGDGHFDAEIYEAIQLTRICMLRLISTNASPSEAISYTKVSSRKSVSG